MNRSQDTSPVAAIGLMSGTSLDGIDVALLETDGERIERIGLSQTTAYDEEFRNRLSAAVTHAGKSDSPVIDQELINGLTDRHIQTVNNILERVSDDPNWAKPSIIGFHGHTTLHRPARKFTQQIGDPQSLADAFHIPVVSDFRRQDVLAGGQGAPLAPVFHAAMIKDESKPIVIVNIGGISNITWIDEDVNELVAFDTGPGNNLLDIWVEKKTGQRYDKNGALAERGQCDSVLLEKMLQHSYFAASWPKSLDRSEFGVDLVEGLGVENGAASLAELTVQTIVRGIDLCPRPPRSIFVTGGGRHNQFLMRRLGQSMSCPVGSVEQLGWNGDAVEAQAFAFMAVRSLRNLPLTFEGTTGVKKPMTGGTLTYPE